MENNEDIDEGYSEEITSPEKNTENCPPLSNGSANGGSRGNTVIDRDENLVFVPEPPQNKTEEKTSEDVILEPKVSYVVF